MIFQKLRWLTRRKTKEAELQEELQFHLNEDAEEREAAGSQTDDARWAARRELGNVTLIREDTRAAWGWTLIEQVLQDARYSVRTMFQNPAFTILAALSLGLGIGANTAIYSFMDSILLRALPVQNPESLVMLKWRAKQQMRWGNFVLHSINGSTFDDGEGTSAGIFPYPAFETFQENGTPFSSLFAYHRPPALNIAAKNQAYLAAGEYVSGDFFRGLSVPPAEGRLLVSEDDRFGAEPVAVISEAFSHKCFGGPEYASGQKILINNAPFTVVGVTPAGFFGVDPGMNPDVFLPLHSNVVVEASSQYGDGAAGYLDKNFYWLDVMGRLKPGVTRQQAQAVIAPLFANWVATTATNDAERANLPALMIQPGATGLETLRRKYSQPLYVLMTLVALILAIACANVANLLLARAAARRREIALRLSVGAGRFRVIRQLLTESVLLSSIGGILGVAFAVWGIRFLTLLLANGNKNFTLRAELNWHVLLVAVALSMITGIVFGLAPALQATRVDVITATKETRAGESLARHSSGRFRLSHALIIGQVAVSLLMLVAAGLFVRTLSNLQSIEVGFNRENLLVFNLNARQAGRPPAEITGLYHGLLRQFKALPGVREVSLSNRSFINAGFGLNHRIPGKPPNGDDRMLVIGPSYFTTMQIPLIAGREIDERDTPGSLSVAMISENFAKVNFPGENPIGKHVSLLGRYKHPETGRDLEIVGVVKDAKYGGLTQKIRPVLYIPYNQGYPEPEDVVFELRTAGDPLAYVNTIREIVRQADSRVPVSNVKTEKAEIDQTINQEIVFAQLCTSFALLALVIACVGLYGTVSYNVSRRTAEIGIRMALGAQRGRLLRMILRQAVILTVLGLAIGVPAALAASKLVKTFLFGMQPNDPLSITGAAATLLAAAILASYAPARRASRIDPMAALRHE
jgi:predicted permease